MLRFVFKQKHFGLFFTVSLGLFGAAAQAEPRPALSEALDAAAGRILPIELGPELAIEGAIVDGSTLRILLSSPIEAANGEDLAERISSFFRSACYKGAYLALLNDGAEIVYDLETPSGLNPAALRLTKASCSEMKIDPAIELRIWTVFQRITQNGLEQTLTEIIDNDRQELTFDGVELVNVEAKEWALTMTITLDRTLVGDEATLRSRFVNFACSDYLMRTLLMAGAKVNYFFVDDQSDDPIRLTFRDCANFGDLTEGALNR